MHIAVLVFVLIAAVGLGVFLNQWAKADSSYGESTGSALVGALIGALIFFVGVVGLFIIWVVWLLH